MAAYIVSTSPVMLFSAKAGSTSRLAVNNGQTNVYIGTSSDVAASGASMGVLLKPGGAFADSGSGREEVWAVGDAEADAHNVATLEHF